MTNKKVLFLAVPFLMMTFSCDSGSKQAAPQPQPAKMPPAVQKKAPSPRQFVGTVAETMNAAGYTYVLLDTGSEKLWFAGPACAVKVGDKLTLPGGMQKENFTSKTLNRTFEKIYFIGSITAPAGKGVCSIPSAKTPGVSAVQEDGKAHTAPPVSAAADLTGLAKPEGGKTIAEIYAGKKELGGKTVTLRGKVVKYNGEIMGKNWLHVQDGSGAAGTNDITVTTKAAAKVGDTVLVQGTLRLDKDFGYGYKYALIIEDAAITKE